MSSLTFPCHLIFHYVGMSEKGLGVRQLGEFNISLLGKWCWTDNWVGRVPLRTKFRWLFDLTVQRECSVADMAVLGWGDGGSAWVWRRGLLTWEEYCVKECFALLHNIVLQEHINDRWMWLLEPNQGYSVCGTYHFLTAPNEELVRGRVCDVCHPFVPSKISVFAWRLLRNRIPTKSNLLRRRVLLQNDV